jgi:hypothetical protein
MLITKMGFRSRLKELFVILLFSIFLVPVSTSSGQSINYAFILFPFFRVLNSKSLLRTPDFILFIIFIYFGIFILSIPFTLYSYSHYFGRSVVSFFIFIIVFSYLLVDIDDEIIRSFKFSVLLVATVMSLFSIYNFIIVDKSDIAMVKDLIGSQRIGFIHTLALSILLFFPDFPNFLMKYRSVLVIIVSLGLVLTFSRTPIVSIFLTYVVYKLTMLNKSGFSKWLLILLLNLATAIVILSFVNIYFPEVYSFFADRIVQRLFSDGSMDILLDSETSEGTRLKIWELVTNYVFYSPVFGSGYLGTYMLSSGISYGSAHSQYMDVFFRTGFFGVCCYLILIYFILKRLRREERSLFFGFVSILFYGFFHETFKESQGGFIFAILLGYSVSKYRKCLRG